MEKKEILRSEDIAHCPKCNANAVEPCQKPQVNDCPRGDNRK
ncbi:hypothetical protein PZB74_04740 [Porifericola rhodea]|nr:hypothetical protein [Porifericola rhodea]WKN32650.1 hypothetical protein PZB74_04740 [Porifericola rhodea]